jgi:hypothetical protein
VRQIVEDITNQGDAIRSTRDLVAVSHTLSLVGTKCPEASLIGQDRFPILLSPLSLGVFHLI